MWWTQGYPLTCPDDPRYRAAVQGVRSELSAGGCSVVRGFLSPSAVATMRRQAGQVAHLAHHRATRTNAYNTADDPSLPADHPVRHFMDRTNAFVATDRIPREHLVQDIYRAGAFQRFVADCLGEGSVHPYDDPFAGLVINVLAPEKEHPWHYDTNEFIVSTLLQDGEGGGVFEYCPDIRSPEAENYDRVGRVLRGDDREVRRLQLRAGDLQIFKGRFALHRVTRVRGSRPRLSAIFAYAKRPGVVGRVERTRQLFGRISPIHLEAERQRRADGLRD